MKINFVKSVPVSNRDVWLKANKETAALTSEIANLEVDISLLKESLAQPFVFDPLEYEEFSYSQLKDELALGKRITLANLYHALAKLAPVEKILFVQVESSYGYSDLEIFIADPNYNKKEQLRRYEESAAVDRRNLATKVADLAKANSRLERLKTPEAVEQISNEYLEQCCRNQQRFIDSNKVKAKVINWDGKMLIIVQGEYDVIDLLNFGFEVELVKKG